MSNRLLIIEDDPDIARLVQTHLRDIDCDADIATDGEQGLVLFAQHRYALVVLDLMLPGIDGLAVCRKLREQGEYVPILMLTAKTTELDRVVGLETGADDYLDTALRQSKRLTRLVSELFELAQLDARQTEPDVEPLAVADLVQDVVQKFSLRAEQAQVGLSVGLGVGVDGAPAEPLPLVLADIALTERVLENLIGNALDHTPEHGAVRVSLYQRGDSVEITVSDNGPGIGAEHLARIFEPFYQAGNRHRGNQHAGLGLAIARRIVELQHGELRVSSEVGHGAAFTFSLSVYPG
jgi:signal transduction histidine kinase